MDDFNIDEFGRRQLNCKINVCGLVLSVMFAATSAGIAIRHTAQEMRIHKTFAEIAEHAKEQPASHGMPIGSTLAKSAVVWYFWSKVKKELAPD